MTRPTTDGLQDHIDRGSQCMWLGKRAADMTRTELIAMVGMLDELATRRHVAVDPSAIDRDPEYS